MPIGIENARVSHGPGSSRLFCLLLVLAAGCAANGQRATDSTAATMNPIPARQDVLIDDGWRFVRSDVGSAQAVGFDDAAWQAVDLPHTWNAQDGQDGTGHYYRGPGWYRRHLLLGDVQAGRRVFLKFDAASVVAQVYVNGQLAGKHSGAFAAFCFDVTALVRAGDNVIAVRVDNTYCPDVPPLTGDFNICGGLYRDAHLLVLAPVCVSPLDDGSSGIYLRTLAVDSSSAQIQVTAVLRNNVDPHRSTYQLLSDALVTSGLPLLAAEVPMRAGFQNAVTAGVPLVHYEPSHAGAEAMRSVARELVASRSSARLRAA